jgi:O-antigen/teichoic acid export membrane protein
VSTAPAIRRDAGGGVRRLGWGLADQSLSSLTNFALSVLVARSVGASSLGAFGLAFTTYTVTLNATRALCSEPLTVRYSATDERRWRDAAASAVGTALVVGVVTGLGCLGVAFLFSGTLRSALIVLGLTMPGLMVQDAWRGAFFCDLRGAYAFANDLVWTIAQVVFVGVALAVGLRTTPVFILAWAGAANIGAVFGSVQAGFLPRPDHARRWLSSSRDLGPRYMVEFVARSAALAGTVYATAAFAGLAAAGSLRAAQVALGPLNILNMGVTAPATAESVRIARRSPRRMLRMVSLMGVVLVVVFTVWGVATYLLPDSVGHALLKRSWDPAHRVLLPYTAVMAASGMLTAATVGLRAMAAAKRSMRSRLITGVLALSLATGGAITYGAVGATCGLAAGLWIGGIQWWQQLHAAVAEEEERRTAARTPVESGAAEAV